MQMETNWDERYREQINSYNDPPREWLTSHAQVLPTEGWVLETAFGLGANIPFLTRQDNRWVGIEKSSEAIRFVRHRYPQARIIRADLSNYLLPLKLFDLICNFYFYERDLYDQFFHVMRPGGYLVVETLTQKMLKWNPEMNPSRLLIPGTLRSCFREWEIVDYREGWFASEHGHEKAIESIIARKPK